MVRSTHRWIRWMGRVKQLQEWRMESGSFGALQSLKNATRQREAGLLRVGQCVFCLPGTVKDSQGRGQVGGA